MMVRSLLPAILSLCASSSLQSQDRVERIVVAPAETLHVSLWGKGDPVVIVPGIWSSTYAFRKVIPGLARNRLRVIVIEPLGVASSSRPRSADYSMTAQSRRIAAALDSLRVRDALFVGQALSASMLLRLAIESPRLIRGMVSLEGGAEDESSTPGLRRGLGIASVLLRIFPSQSLIRPRVRSNLENVSGDRSWITPEVVNAYMAPWRNSIFGTVQAYRSMATSREQLRLRTLDDRLDLPVNLLIGMAPHYGQVTQAELAPLEKLVRELSITRVPRAGHLLHEERPDDVVKAVLEMRRQVASR